MTEIYTDDGLAYYATHVISLELYLKASSPNGPNVTFVSLTKRKLYTKYGICRSSRTLINCITHRLSIINLGAFYKLLLFTSTVMTQCFKTV